VDLLRHGVALLPAELIQPIAHYAAIADRGSATKLAAAIWTLGQESQRPGHGRRAFLLHRIDRERLLAGRTNELDNVARIVEQRRTA
jgi:hypothetical protein